MDLAVLYNNAPGCQPYSGLACGADDITDARYGGTNYDHDAIINGFPTGSGAGINGLPAPANYAQGDAMARSSRGPNAGETGTRTFWGYGVDGIGVITFGSRSGIQLTSANVIAIFTCAVTNWNDASIMGGAQPAGTIVPWAMNPASGTSAVFVGFLGFTANTAGVNLYNAQTCVRWMAGADGITGTSAARGDDVAPFENDTKQLLDDPGIWAGINPSIPSDYIWWMSFATYSTYPYKGSNPVDAAHPARISANLVQIDTLNLNATAVFNQTWVPGLTRLIWNVTNNVDADCVTPAGGAGACNNVDQHVAGAASGVGGAVRMFTEFLCRTTDAQSIAYPFGTYLGKQDLDPLKGVGYRTRIIQTLNKQGFQQIKVGTTNPKFNRTAGYACFVDTTT
jgi:hypothetical protein